VPQGVGGAEANGGPSLENFAPPRHHGRPPHQRRTAVADGQGPSDLIATARWDADGIGRGRPPYK
jgi:hypothetical protein